MAGERELPAWGRNQFGGCLINHVIDLLGVGGVQDTRRDIEPIGVKFGDGVGEDLGASSGDANACSVRGQGSGHGLAEVGAASGDDCAATRQIEHVRGWVQPRHVVSDSMGKHGRGIRCHARAAMSDCVGPGVATRIIVEVSGVMYWKLEAVFITII